MVGALAIVGIVAGLASAGCWFWSAWINTPLPMAYIERPPQWVIDTILFQSRLNAMAAIGAGVATGCQAIVFLRQTFLPQNSRLKAVTL
jgi:hypothetical protein